MPTTSFSTASSRAASTGVLVGQRATLTAADRVSGQPANPAYKIETADVRVEVLGSYHGVDGTVTLAATPPGDTYVELGFGNRSGGTCVVTSAFSEYLPSGYGRVVTFDDYATDLARPWDCVVALTSPNQHSSPGTARDILIGLLANTYERPRLAIGKVSLLGKAQKKLKLVKGVPTTIEVVVRNTGSGEARGVVVTGKGKKLKVTRGTVGTIGPGASGTATVRVKLKGKKPGKLRLHAKGSGIQVVRKLKVKKVGPPARPRAGKYRNKKGTVRFAIRKGKVVGWHGWMQTRCGGYPSLPTYTMNTYDFRKVKIPRNGIVQASQRGRNYGAQLRLKAVASKVTRGRFNYSGPGRCSAVITFSAKRVGK